MKKLFFILLTVVLFAALASPTWAGSKQLTFAWEQVLPETNDLKEWRIYSATQSGGPYTLTATVPYVSPQTTYTKFPADDKPGWPTDPVFLCAYGPGHRRKSVGLLE